jgi:peptidoglycan hydrolase CwlO-like protein
MAFQSNAFQNDAFQVDVVATGAGGTAGGRGYGRLVHTGPNYYPFGKKEEKSLVALEKKKKKLEKEVSEIQRELEQKQAQADSMEASRTLEFIQSLKQKLLILWEQIAALELELSWLKDLKRIAEEREIEEVMEVYLIARMH